MCVSPFLNILGLESLGEISEKKGLQQWRKGSAFVNCLKTRFNPNRQVLTRH